MNDQKQSDQIEEAKKMLSKMDPELAVMAIQHLEVNFEEVKEIKEYLAKCDPKAVKYAIAEVQQEEISKEFVSVKEKLSTFNVEVLKEAAVGLGILKKVGLCYNGINCKGACVQVMILGCLADMYAKFNPIDQVINPDTLETIIKNAMDKTLSVK